MCFNKLSRSIKGADAYMRMLRGVAKTENAMALAAKATSKVARAAAPLARALKPLAPALKVAGRVAGALGVATSVVELVTAKTTDERVDAGIGLVGNALMASDNPVLTDGGGGILLGQYAEKKLVRSRDRGEGFSSSDTASTAMWPSSLVVTVASTPIALDEAGVHKVMSWFH
jgi:hypothetical protein